MSFSVEISTRGLEFDDVVQKLSGPLRQKLIESLADVAWAHAFWKAPRITGKLASTIIKEVSDSVASIEVLAPYAIYVVKGTRPHVIRPVNECGRRFTLTISACARRKLFSIEYDLSKN